MSPNHRLDQRLDDELRKAFKREQPSADFTMRLLERVAQERAPRESFARKLKKLALLLEPPKLRWLAIGVTASLLLAIGLMQYTRVKTVSVDENLKVAAKAHAPIASDKEATQAQTPDSAEPPAINTPSPRPKNSFSSSTSHRLTQARRQEERELRAEGEAAKETLMLALSIASSTLNDAQKAVHDDGMKP